jgi:hypothetical protein
VGLPVVFWTSQKGNAWSVDLFEIRAFPNISLSYKICLVCLFDLMSNNFLVARATVTHNWQHRAMQIYNAYFLPNENRTLVFDLLYSYFIPVPVYHGHHKVVKSVYPTILTLNAFAITWQALLFSCKLKTWILQQLRFVADIKSPDILSHVRCCSYVYSGDLEFDRQVGFSIISSPWFPIIFSFFSEGTSTCSYAHIVRRSLYISSGFIYRLCYVCLYKVSCPSIPVAIGNLTYK